MAYIGQTLTEGTRRAYTFTATASQTTFNAVYGVGAVDVYQNGILLQPADYTATTGTTVVLGVGAAVNDEITIIAHNTFSVADTVSSSQGGTFIGDVTHSGNVNATTRLQVGDSSITNAYSGNPAFGYVADFQGSSGTQTYISIAAPTASSVGDNGVVIGEDATDTYFTQRGNKNIKLGTQDINRLIIDGSGRVTMPSQAYGEAEGNDGGLLASFSSGSIINWLTANHTNGGMSFSNSGRFTVPVAGRYLVSALIYYYPSGSHTAYYSLEIKKNGSLEAFKIDDHVETVSGSIDRTVSINTIVRCSANDYLELGWSSNINASFWRGADHNKFRVLLLN